MRCDNFDLTLSNNAKNCSGCNWKDTFLFGPNESAAAATFASIFALFGTGLNLLVVISLLHYKRTRSHATTPFIVSLSILDLIYSGVFLPIFAVRFSTGEPAICDGFCKFYPVMFYGTMGASLLSLTMVTLNRVCMLYLPNKFDKIFKKREFRGHEIPVNSMLILLFCWIFPALLVLPSYFKGQTGLNINTGSCTILPNKECSGSKTFFYLFGFGFPCVTLILSDLAIWKRMKEIHANDTRMSVAKADERRMERLFMMMLAAIFILFLITYLPTVAVKSLDKCYNYPTLHVVAYIINWATVVINPIIYCVSQKKYQDAIFHLKNSLQECLNIGRAQEQMQVIPTLNINSDTPDDDINVNRSNSDVTENLKRPVTMRLTNRNLDNIQARYTHSTDSGITTDSGSKVNKTDSGIITTPEFVRKNQE